MCNQNRFDPARDTIAADFAKLQIPLRWVDAAANRPPGDPIKPTNRATILRPVDAANPRAGVEGHDVRWWMVPFFHKGAVKDCRAMCTNARYETVETTAAFREAYKKRRCLVPSDELR
jgi:putative SOS response-associated peptidase YedK